MHGHIAVIRVPWTIVRSDRTQNACRNGAAPKNVLYATPVYNISLCKVSKS